MATPKLPRDGDYFATVALETEDHAAAVEVVDRMVQFALLSPVTTTRVTFTRAEARDVAYSMIEATQRMIEEGS
jgi:hypothetical protein